MFVIKKCDCLDTLSVVYEVSTILVPSLNNYPVKLLYIINTVIITGQLYIILGTTEHFSYNIYYTEYCSDAKLWQYKYRKVIWYNIVCRTLSYSPYLSLINGYISECNIFVSRGETLSEHCQNPNSLLFLPPWLLLFNQTLFVNTTSLNER